MLVIIQGWASSEVMAKIRFFNDRLPGIKDIEYRQAQRGPRAGSRVEA